jgi:quinohemoprotein ethanol dehydrogenase
MKQSGHLLVALAAALLVAGGASTAVASGAGAAPDLNWPGPGGQPDENGYAALTAINSGNVGKLGLAWYLDLPGEQSLEATPLAVNGVIYFTGSFAAVYAVDANSGKLLWKYDPEIWKSDPGSMSSGLSVNRGAAYADGRVFSATKNGHLLALDAKTGKLLWDVDTIGAKTMYSITGAPRAFKGKVIIGNSGSDFGMRGYVTAYDAATGKQVWRFYTVPGSPEQNQGDPAMDLAAASWTGNYWRTGTGGAVWDNITFDAELNRVYLGTGNAAPYDPKVRSPGGGDNLYTASIVALDADTGKYAWHYQINPMDSWDYDCTQRMSLAELTINGERRKVLMQAPKNGFFYVIDRRNGKLISAGKIGKATWADHIDVPTGRPVEQPNIRYETGEVTIWPGTLGAHNWQPTSFSPKTGLVYVPLMQLGARFYKGPPQPGEVSFGGMSITNLLKDADDGKGFLLAWDPVAQKARWSVKHPYMWNGGTMVTAGNVVFQGTADGYFSAFDATTGKQLWRFNAGLGIIAAPSSYTVGGRQYVSVLVGYGGTSAIFGQLLHAGWRYGAQPRRLLTFALDGKAVLPPSPPPSFAVHALDDPALEISPTDIDAGRNIYTFTCGVCHGLSAVSTGGTGPDLRESAIALKLDTLSAFLPTGALLSRGMPRFGQLSPEQVRLIHVYIRSSAREALKK